jgi:putative two-component system response regulator
VNNITEERAVAHLAELLALECGMRPAAARQVRGAAALHDVGKIKLPSSIVNKSGPLTRREFDIMKTHTILGAKMLKSIRGNIGAAARTAALYHHEYHNGCGYWGKKLCDLPRYVEIIAIADTYTALVSKRVYKHAWPQGDALGYIQGKAGTQFSPWMTDTFINLIRKGGVPTFLQGGDGIARGA